MSDFVPYFLGCDASKGYADFVVLDNVKTVVENCFQFDDTFEGHTELYQFFAQFFAKHQNAIVYAAVESTGGYENNWFSTLNKFQEDFNIKVARLNPKGVNHSGKASLKRVTTDKVSAFTIAEYLINHSDKVVYENESYLYSLRRKWHFIQSLIKQRTRLSNQLEKYLYYATPELLIYCRDGIPRWMLKLLQLCPSARTLAEASIEALVAIPYISTNKAVKLIERAKDSVASLTDEMTEDSISLIASEILRLTELIKEQKDLLVTYCDLPEVTLLKSFKSIGTHSAIGLLIEIGVIERFKSVKHLASFVGVHPKFKESGDGTWGMHMSKEGRSAARAILFMIAMSAIQRNSLIQEVYLANIKKGKEKMDAMGVCMHKILRIVYGILKNKQAFNPEIDRRNRSKNNKKKSSGKNTKRRYQELDENAPISRRQNKKRKEQ